MRKSKVLNISPINSNNYKADLRRDAVHRNENLMQFWLKRQVRIK